MAYPTSLDNLPTDKSDATTMVSDHPGHHNDLATALNAVEAELGLTPSAGFATLKARLADLDVLRASVHNVMDSVYGAVGDGVADDHAAIQAALTAAGAAGGGTVFLPAGTYAISALLTVPPEVDIRGAGMLTSILKATAAAAGIVYGGDVGDSPTYHGHSSDFQFNGNEISTAGFKANTITAHFSDIAVTKVDGDGFYILGQNSSFERIVPSVNAGSNFVFDNGAGHNSLFSSWSFQATNKGIEFRRSAESGPGLYDVPTYNYVSETIVEADGEATWGANAEHAAVGHTAGKFNYFAKCELHNYENDDQPSVYLAPDPNGNACGRLYFEDCTFGTSDGSTAGAIHADAVSGGAAGAFNADAVVVTKGDNVFVEWDTAILWGTSSPIRDLGQRTLYGTPTYFTPDGTGAAGLSGSGALLEQADAAALRSYIDAPSNAMLTVVTANTQTDSYTLVLGDAGMAVEINHASAKTLTVPPNADVAFPTGTVIELHRYGAGTVTVTPGSGVTIRSPGGLLALASQYSSASLRKRGTNEWVLSGSLV